MTQATLISEYTLYICSPSSHTSLNVINEMQTTDIWICDMPFLQRFDSDQMSED